MRFLVALLMVVLTAASPGEEPAGASVNRLVEALGSEDPAVRRMAAAEIEHAESELAPFLERAIAEATDPEISVKLDEILHGPLFWHDCGLDALRDAEAAELPILMVLDPGPPGVALDIYGCALRQQTLRDHRVRAELRRSFVLLWLPRGGGSYQPFEPAPEVSAAEPGQCEAWLGPELFFATSDGIIRHKILGWLSADFLLEEIVRARKLIDAPTLEAASRLRSTMAEEIELRSRRAGHDLEAEDHGGIAICRDPACVLYRISQQYSRNGSIGKSVCWP